MYTQRQTEYLKNMGIDVWVLRRDGDQAAPLPAPEISVSDGRPAPAGEKPRVLLGPGTGDILLLCRDAAESASRLAADIARSLDCEPVWGWPEQNAREAGISLDRAIEDRLFTRVLVFGAALHQSGSGAGPVGKARVIYTESMDVLQQQASARKALWAKLYEHHWFAERARKS